MTRPQTLPSAVLIVDAGALMQGTTLVSFPAVSAMLKQTLALSDADYGAGAHHFSTRSPAARSGDDRTETALGAGARANTASQALLAGAAFGSHSAALSLFSRGRRVSVWASASSEADQRLSQAPLSAQQRDPRSSPLTR